MIPVNAPLWQTESWQQQMRNMIREPDRLMAALGLKANDAPDLASAMKQFPLRVPEAFVAKMTRGDWRDPLLLQVLPQAREMAAEPGYSDDPLEERDSNPVPGLIHKYQGRVLLVTTPACAVHCRYCFRRHFPYQDNTPGQRDWQLALDYIGQRADISEVILSGGDPLAAADDYLQRLIDGIAQIPHVTTLRLHTRLPVVLPGRISDTLIRILSGTRLQVVMVIHCNHGNELDEITAEALARLRQAGIHLLNQSVLLAGINDRPEILATLSHKLFQQGVQPYYLHLLDKVAGAAHFDLAEERAIALVRTLRDQLPGYLVPHLVRESPQAGSKLPVAI